MLEPSGAQNRDLGAIALTYSLTLCLALGLVSGVFRSSRGTQHLELAVWCSGPVKAHCIRSRGGGEEKKNKEEGVAPLLKSRDPYLAGMANHTIGRLHSPLRVLDSNEKRRKDRNGF